MVTTTEDQASKTTTGTSGGEEDASIDGLVDGLRCVCRACKLRWVVGQ